MSWNAPASDRAIRGAQPEAECPNCGSSGLVDIYEVDGVPAHSCLLMRSRTEAEGYPCGDIRLAWCEHCGFASNRVFREALNEYSPDYEEVQTFSPTFNRFQSELIDHLIESRGVHDKDVIEIGCGKGEFLMELCARGGNRGVGIDPSYVPGRGRWGDGADCQFMVDYFDPARHARLPMDVIVCRHTLEHIAPTGEFLRSVREAIGRRRDTLVFFELPDQERVYRENAFWDIYYEHCSYFTDESLRYLFELTGFEVMDSWKGFDDQYLLIEARPRAEWSGSRDAGPVTSTAARDRVRSFEAEVPRVIDGWRKRLRAYQRDGRRVAIWGAGSKGVAFLTTLDVGNAVAHAIDINPHKHGFFMPGSGHEVIAPDELTENPPHVVVVMNPVYRDEIRECLAERGLAPEILGVGED